MEVAMSTKKEIIKANEPEPKKNDSQSVKKEEKEASPAKWTKIQTAEGWKRSMKKSHPKK
jgi:hypothetical protein